MTYWRTPSHTCTTLATAITCNVNRFAIDSSLLSKPEKWFIIFARAGVAMNKMHRPSFMNPLATSAEITDSFDRNQFES